MVNSSDRLAGLTRPVSASVAASVQMYHQWLLRQLILGPTGVGRVRHPSPLRPPEYRDLLQARPSDAHGLK